MTQRRKKYSQEFKNEAVQMVIEGSRPTAQIARELGLAEQTLGNWVTAYRKSRPTIEDSPLATAERIRIRELEKEIKELRMQNEFLGKAAAFFAQEYR